MPVIKKMSKEASSPASKADSLSVAYNTQRIARKKMGPSAPVTADHEEHYSSIADAILKKKKMADGGMVEPDDNEETPASLSPYDDDNEDAILKELYDEDLGPQPEDSDEDGDDMISQIRKKMKRG